jgi:molybdenum cofactor cytidylyltransferase
MTRKVTPAARISAIVLAAGKSLRFGSNKQLAPLGKSTVLEMTIDNYLASEAREIVVVLGHMSGNLSRFLGDRPVKRVMNPRYQEGMSTSLIAGINNISPSADGIILALADQPFVDTQTINRLIKAFGAGKSKGIVVPVYEGRRGNPVILSRKYVDELLKVKGDVGGREIIAAHPEDVKEVAVTCKGVLQDIDTPEQYRDALDSESN